MFVQRVEIAVRDGQEAAFEAALCEVRQQVFMTRGFRDFTVAQGVEEPGTYMVQVLWETTDELLEFTGSGRFERCWAPVEPFLGRSLRVDHLVERHGLGLQGPGVLTDLV